MTLSAKIHIQTDSIPYTVYRRMPPVLTELFPGDRDWVNFCDSLDRRLRPYDEIKDRWKSLSYAFLCCTLCLIVGIVLRFVLVENEDTRFYVTCALFGSTFLVYSAYFFLMQALVVKPRQDLRGDLMDFCDDLSKKFEPVMFQFEVSGRWCTIFMDSDFSALIHVTSTDPMVARTT